MRYRSHDRYEIEDHNGIITEMSCEELIGHAQDILNYERKLDHIEDVPLEDEEENSEIIREIATRARLFYETHYVMIPKGVI